jgi:D-alanyl-D-alanine carboxypeptidase
MTLTAVLAVTTVLALRGANTAGAETPTHRDSVPGALAGLVNDDHFPAALAAVRSRDGQTRNYTAGVGDLTTSTPVPVDGQVRIGSNTKPFVSVVVLQLVGEGKIGLDEPIETYLPRLIRGQGIDGRQITVRQLLQHTSGLPDYVDLLLADGFAPIRHQYFTPKKLLEIGLSRPASFAPGTSWEYSNTNYIVAGLLIEKVTGHPVEREITDRVIHRIGLRHTYFPTARNESVDERHPHGYEAETPDGPLQDVTTLNPAWAWTAGAMVATPSDLNRFFTALMNGKLLKPAQFRQMRTTVDTANGLWPGARYGLGLISTPLSCGGLAWGHGGDIPGYHTRNAVTDDGRAVTVAVTAGPTAQGPADRVQAIVDLGLCR